MSGLLYHRAAGGLPGDALVLHGKKRRRLARTIAQDRRRARPEERRAKPSSPMPFFLLWRLSLFRLAILLPWSIQKSRPARVPFRHPRACWLLPPASP